MGGPATSGAEQESGEHRPQTAAQPVRDGRRGTGRDDETEPVRKREAEPSGEERPERPERSSSPTRTEPDHADHDYDRDRADDPDRADDRDRADDHAADRGHRADDDERATDPHPSPPTTPTQSPTQSPAEHATHPSVAEVTARPETTSRRALDDPAQLRRLLSESASDTSPNAAPSEWDDAVTATPDRPTGL